MSKQVVINTSEETTVKHFAEVVVNGTSLGKREINGGPSLLDFCNNVASEHGTRTFTINHNGGTVTDAAVAAATPVRNGDTIKVQAKDSRGLALHCEGADEAEARHEQGDEEEAVEEGEESSDDEDEEEEEEEDEE